MVRQIVQPSDQIDLFYWANMLTIRGIFVYYGVIREAGFLGIPPRTVDI